MECKQFFHRQSIQRYHDINTTKIVNGSRNNEYTCFNSKPKSAKGAEEALCKLAFSYTSQVILVTGSLDSLQGLSQMTFPDSTGLPDLSARDKASTVS